MQTLYDQNPAAWDAIAAQGKHHVAKMARRFTDYASMDRALGFVRASHNWAARGGQVSNAAEASARNWLAANPEPEPAAPASDGVLMVIPPAAKLDAVRRVLAALGCEVIDV